ncbi:uncharacterized protein LOC132751427 [Ruditapes philippinarum]|uniref:uncharacterized protein LOC132751427 n=1 Tax=Ruditapes philippinarum TaxID=129788 RepID=UPI00295B1A7B|nr:uncharacterized protein LOC132751427 [Ruditapes philippinarum]
MIESEYNIKVAEKVSGTSTLKRFQSLSVVSLDRLSSMYPPSPTQGMKKWKQTKRAVGGSLTNVSSSPAITVSPSPNKPTYTRVQSVWVKADKGDRSTPMKGLQTKVNKKLTNKRASQVSNASSSDSPDSSNRNSLEHPIELNEQITPRRPPRPESEKERRNSQRLSAQFTHMGHLPGASPENCDSGDDDGPPPLPVKHSENSKLSFDAPPLPSRQSLTPTKTPRKSKPSVKASQSLELNSNPLETAPPLLPEKITPSRSFDGESL